MIRELNTYINLTGTRVYPDDTMFGMKKNRMFIFYNMDHYSKDNRSFMVRSLISQMISKYHLKYNVEFVESDINRVVIQKVRRNANPTKLRLIQIKVNRELREFLSEDMKIPKI